MNAPEDALAGILAEHVLHHAFVGHGVAALAACSCGRTHENTLTASWPIQEHLHHAHVAQVLAEWAAGEKAQAWDEAITAVGDAWADDTPLSNPYRKDQEASDD